MRYFSTFSGVGGFELGIQYAYEKRNRELGIERAYRRLGRNGQEDIRPSERQETLDSSGAHIPQTKRSDGHVIDQPRTEAHPTCVGFSEIDKYAIKVYQKHFRQPKTKEEIESDLVQVKTIVSENNYDIMEVCYVNNVKQETSFIKTTNQLVKTALENTSLSGVKTILKKAGKQGENIMLCEDSECSICMGEDVSVVENLKKCSLPLNTKMEMDTLNESNMELAICINSPLKNIDQTDTKSYATTVITLKEDIIYAHIKKTKPHKNWGDITKIEAEGLPDFDLLVGGFPCPSFSIAGKRKGLEDVRGQLVFDVIRILRGKKPKMFLLENVKGLLSHDGGRTMEIICEELCESGYAIDFEVLNSKNFGVPQNRERVFIVGKRLDTLPSGAIY